MHSGIVGWFVRVSEHVWEERDLGDCARFELEPDPPCRDGHVERVVATHWTTTKRDRNQQTTLDPEDAEA